MLKDRFDSHYGSSMRPCMLRAWAMDTANDMVEEFGAGGQYAGEFPVFLYTGMSGISTANALAMFLPSEFEFGMMYVRKENEESHGCSVESNNLGGISKKKVRFVFCDDFICMGGTLKRVLVKVQDVLEFEMKFDDVLTALSGKGTLMTLQRAVETNSDRFAIIKSTNDALEESMNRVNDMLAARSQLYAREFV